VDAAEAGIEAAPACDAVDVGRDLGLGQRLKLVVGEDDLVLDLAEDAKVPRREVGLRHAPGVEDGPLLGDVLARRQALRVVARVGDLSLGPGAEHAA